MSLNNANPTLLRSHSIHDAPSPCLVNPFNLAFQKFASFNPRDFCKPNQFSYCPFSVNRTTVPAPLHILSTMPSLCIWSTHLIWHSKICIFRTSKPLGKIKVTICNHQAGSPLCVWPDVRYGDLQVEKKYGHI